MTSHLLTPSPVHLIQENTVYTEAMDDANPRLFFPAQQARHNPFTHPSKPTDILYHSADTGTHQLVVYPAFNPTVPRAVQSSLVLSISSENQEYRITFAPESALNTSGPVPEEYKSGTRRDLCGLEKALEIVEKLYSDRKTSKAVVITTAAELVEGLSKNVWDWEYSGYDNVTDGEVFKALHKRIAALEGEGVDVCFWLVEAKDKDVLGVETIHRPVVWSGLER